MDCTLTVSKNLAIIRTGNYNAARQALGLSVRCVPPGLQPQNASGSLGCGPLRLQPGNFVPTPAVGFLHRPLATAAGIMHPRTEEMKMTVAPNRPSLPVKQGLPESLQSVNPSTASTSPPPLSPLAGGASNRAISIPPAKKPVRIEARRCAEKGCIYPAGPGESGRCRQHQRQQHEPTLFHSRQPSMILLDCAKFGLPEEEPEDSRFRDRRRLAAQREAFLGGAA